MLWKITTEKGTFELSEAEVTNLLIGQLLEKEHLDHDEIVLSFMKHLQAGGTLHQVQLTQLAVMAFTLGYYYRIMKDKYDIDLEVDSEPTVNSSERNKQEFNG